LGQDREANSQTAFRLILLQRYSCETPHVLYYVPVLIDLHGILLIESRMAASPLASAQPARQNRSKLFFTLLLPVV